MSMATHITVRVPMTIRQRPGRKTVITPMALAGVPTVPTRADPALVKALARAFRYQKLLDDGRYASISEMAAAEKIERGYLGSLLRLTLLAPGLVEAVLEGRQAEGVTLAVFSKGIRTEWAVQRSRFAASNEGVQDRRGGASASSAASQK